MRNIASNDRLWAVLSVVFGLGGLLVAAIAAVAGFWDYQFLGFPHSPEADDPALYAAAVRDLRRFCSTAGYAALAIAIASSVFGWLGRRTGGNWGFALSALTVCGAGLLFALASSFE